MSGSKKTTKTPHHHTIPFIVTSNICLLFPIIASYLKGEWIYFGISVTIMVASACFHYGQIYYHDHIVTKVFRDIDWSLAILGSFYTMFYIYQAPPSEYKILLSTLFLSTIAFFWYGFKFGGNYQKLHPYFHVTAQTILGFIVLLL